MWPPTRLYFWRKQNLETKTLQTVVYRSNAEANAQVMETVHRWPQAHYGFVVIYQFKKTSKHMID